MSKSFEKVFECYHKGDFPLYDGITPWHDVRDGLKNQFVTTDNFPLFTYDLYGWVLLNEPNDRIIRFINHYSKMDFFQPSMVTGICSCLDQSCGGSEAECTMVNAFLKKHDRMDILPIVSELKK